jgi:hypothetical protein
MEGAVLTTSAGIETIGARPIPEFEGVHDVWPRGKRLEAVREAAAAYKQRFKTQGEIRAVKSVDIAAAPYPTQYAFHGAAIAPATPYVSIVNRMVVVQYDDFDGNPRTLVFEPTVPEGSAEAPFYDQLQKRINAVPGGERLAEALYLKYYHEPEDALPLVGLAPEDVDYATFDHLHVQDVRMIMGTSKPIPGEHAPRPPLFPRAKLLAHRKEVATFESLHPMQWAWYVDGGMDGVDAESLVLFEGDIELGVGVSLIWTPGHTDGNHSLCLNTPDGVWVSSENGVALDNWQPEQSRIPGIRSYARHYNREIVPNANTLEDSLDQYDSMVKEKTLADPSKRDPRWLQVLPSSELADWKRLWPVRPTFAHGGIAYGTIVKPNGQA